MSWTMWSDTEQLSDIEFTEQEARNILKEENYMLAKNAAGDEITEHDGPIHVARVSGKQDDSIQD
jgi:hypothetical protein